ncbi:2OG-Fe(II) oxygenase [bacterium]|nr:2OG-Fe(II) oxygenase [bacterium]
MIDDVKTKGYVKFYEPGISDLVSLDKHKLTNTEERQRDNGEKDIDPLLHQRFTVVGSYLHTKYIKPTHPKSEYLYYNVWNGVDKDNQGWHTDFMEGYDLFFLYYFDTTKEETGGNISFRHDKGEDTFQPVKGDLFLVSNERGFWHKAGDTKIQRRVASFNFKTNAI